MGIHDVLVGEITSRGERLLRRLDELNLLLVFIREPDESVLGSWESASRDARALAIVCSMAELESLTRFVIQLIHSELNNATLMTRDIRPCMRQIAAHQVFESLKRLEDHAKLWERRAYATTLDGCSDVLALPIERRGPQPPLDGRTLRPEHFYRMWAIYGLPGDAFPFVSWATSLQKLALVRNDIAHANLAFSEIFQQAGMTVAEVEGYLKDIGEFSIHLISSWTDYLDRQLYLGSALYEVDQAG